MLEDYVAVKQVTGPKGNPRPYVFPGWPNGVVMQSETWIEPRDKDSPWATCSSFPENTGSWAHFHTGAQFQFVMTGSMHFPDHTIHAPAVHYAQHCVPYGPFTVSGEHKMYILRPFRNRQVYSPSPLAGNLSGSREEVHRLVNRSGQYFIKSARDVEWEPLPGQKGARRKVLVPGIAEMIEVPAGTEISGGIPTYGQYQIVLSGTATVNGKDLGYKGLRFVRGDEAPPPLRSGRDGATVAILSYDGDVLWREPEVPGGHQAHH